MRRSGSGGTIVAALSTLILAALTGGAASAAVRTYYIAADQVDWGYLPGGADTVGMEEAFARCFATRGPHLIGRIYRKAIYRQYTDATFKHLKPRKPRDAYLGILGPIIYAEVGDTIRVVFKNNTTHPCSMHSHVNELQDVNTGLIGAIIITRKGMALPNGRPKGVSRNFVVLFMIFNENDSSFLNHNIKTFTADPTHVNELGSSSADLNGRFSLVGTGFVAQNLPYTINGYQFADGPVMRMKKGTHVRWYLFTVGDGFNAHTPHWHGNTVLTSGHRTDVVSLAPAQMVTADMWPTDPGIWLLHRHFSDHMEGGMAAMYQVLP